jgi:hypothetical protein
MKSRLVSAAFTAALTLWGGQARADEVPRPMIAVVVHDYTSFSDAVLQRAKDDVSLILRRVASTCCGSEPQRRNPWPPSRFRS